MTLPQAILKLRETSGESRQVFATILKISMKALQNYENGLRVPPPKVLLWLAARADDLNNDELYARFLDKEFLEQLEMPPGWELTINFKRTEAPVVVPPGTVGVLTQKMERKITKRKV